MTSSSRACDDVLHSNCHFDLILRLEQTCFGIPNLFLIFVEFINERMGKNKVKSIVNDTTTKRNKDEEMQAISTPKRRKKEDESRSKNDGDVATEDKQNKRKRVNRRLVTDDQLNETESSKNNNSNIDPNVNVPKGVNLREFRKAAVNGGRGFSTQNNFDGELRAFLNPRSKDSDSDFFELMNKKLEDALSKKRAKGKTKSQKPSQNKVINSGDEEVEESDSFRMQITTEETESDGESSSESETEEPPQQDLRQVIDKSKGPIPPEKERQLAEFERLKKLPDVQEFLKLMGNPDETKEKAGKRKSKKSKDTGSKKGTKGIPVVNNVNNTPIQPFAPVVKSPSEPTIYVPALRYEPNAHQGNDVTNVLNRMRAETEVQDNISQRLNDIRIGHFPGDAVPGASQDRPEEKGRPSKEDLHTQARRIAEDMILDSERNRATIAAPAGRNIVSNQIFQTESARMGAPPVDDNFNDDRYCNATQGTKHVDETVAIKIGKGGFVELDKIVPRFKDLRQVNDDQRFQLKINKEGQSYYVPMEDKEAIKINSFGRWEQAFRVYAAIYTRVNPHRGAEIYQYIHSINCAATSFTWENVAYYDYHFRKDMERFPQRSWAKTNTQLWTLSMRDPLPSRSFQSPVSGGKKDFRDTACWRYNRNQCRKSAKDCKFEHRCSFCGGNNHIYPDCYKRKRQNGGNDSRMKETKDSVNKAVPTQTGNEKKQ